MGQRARQKSRTIANFTRRGAACAIFAPRFILSGLRPLSFAVYEAHHKKMDFDAEFLALLKKHGMEFDPKFVFG